MEGAQGSFLILAYEAAVAFDIGAEDGGELTVPIFTPHRKRLSCRLPLAVNRKRVLLALLSPRLAESRSLTVDCCSSGSPALRRLSSQRFASAGSLKGTDCITFREYSGFTLRVSATSARASS